MAEFVLLTGPMVGAGSWLPTASVLRSSGHCVHVPDVLRSTDSPPPWRAWTAHLRRLWSNSEPVVLVGHSAATHFAAALATQVPSLAVVLIDGEIPANGGTLAPAEGRFRALVDSLPREGDLLPRWSDWWHSEPQASIIGVTSLRRQPELFADFYASQPRVPIGWFDDVIEILPWQHVPTGYLQTSRFFAESAAAAESSGWPTIRIDGTHLHPTLQPVQTATAIESLVSSLVPAA